MKNKESFCIFSSSSLLKGNLSSLHLNSVKIVPFDIVRMRVTQALIADQLMLQNCDHIKYFIKKLCNYLIRYVSNIRQAQLR